MRPRYARWRARPRNRTIVSRQWYKASLPVCRSAIVRRAAATTRSRPGPRTRQLHEEVVMHFLTRRALSRRAMLRGAGTVLALPLLDAMIPATVHAAPAPRPRAGFLYMAHGAIMDRWTPAGEGRNFELS